MVTSSKEITLRKGATHTLPVNSLEKPFSDRVVHMQKSATQILLVMTDIGRLDGIAQVSIFVLS